MQLALHQVFLLLAFLVPSYALADFSGPPSASPTPVASPAPERRELSTADLTALMDTARENPTNGYKCSGDGCFVRADLFARDLIKAGANPDDIQKAIIRYPEGSKWSYHIATVYKGQVVDPLNSKPMSPKDWAQSFAVAGKECREGDTTCARPKDHHVYGLAKRDQFSPHDSGEDPSLPTSNFVRGWRKWQLDYVKEKSGNDYFNDGRRVDREPAPTRSTVVTSAPVPAPVAPPPPPPPPPVPAPPPPVRVVAAPPPPAPLPVPAPIERETFVSATLPTSTHASSVVQTRAIESTPESPPEPIGLSDSTVAASNDFPAPVAASSGNRRAPDRRAQPAIAFTGMNDMRYNALESNAASGGGAGRGGSGSVSSGIAVASTAIAVAAPTSAATGTTASSGALVFTPPTDTAHARTVTPTLRLGTTPLETLRKIDSLLGHPELVSP